MKVTCFFIMWLKLIVEKGVVGPVWVEVPYVFKCDKEGTEVICELHSLTVSLHEPSAPCCTVCIWINTAYCVCPSPLLFVCEQKKYSSCASTNGTNELIQMIENKQRKFENNKYKKSGMTPLNIDGWSHREMIQGWWLACQAVFAMFEKSCSAFCRLCLHSHPCQHLEQ